MPKLISVILTTYNSPDWLAKVLWGYASQSYGAFDVVIADDGSTDETAAVIHRFQKKTSLRLKHVWHEDNGFRKCEILNKAIEQCDGEYLLFSDGDCVPRSDFVRVHARFAQPGHFLSGGYYKLPMSISNAVTPKQIKSGEAFQLPWLRKQGLPLSHRYLRLMQRPALADLLNRLTTTKPTWNGNNSSGWKSDIVAANGFDERMRYGGLDRELGERLENAGIRGKHVRFQALCLHLDHPRGYENEADWKRNNEIREATRTQRAIQTAHGIRKVA